MNISYSCNDAYIEQTGISMISLFINNKEEDEINIYLVSKDISQNNIDVLKNICDQFNRNLIVVDFNEIAYDLCLSSTGRHIETIYTKVFFSRIKDVDKLIYLDSDTVVVSSLKELWEEPLDDCYMGVVETLPTKYYKELGLSRYDRFFNDGMALVNVEYCRKHDLIGQVLNVVGDFNGNPPTLSEGALNKVCFGHVKYISPKYNLMAGLLYLCSLDAKYMSTVLHYTEDELRVSCKNPVVIHYLSAFYNRPWYKKCTHPYKDYYYNYKNISPWRDIPLRDGDLPIRIKLIDFLYKLLGVRSTERIRQLLEKCKA